MDQPVAPHVAALVGVAHFDVVGDCPDEAGHAPGRSVFADDDDRTPGRTIGVEPIDVLDTAAFFVGVMEGAELENGRPILLVVAAHPPGFALDGLGRVDHDAPFFPPTLSATRRGRSTLSVAVRGSDVRNSTVSGTIYRGRDDATCRLTSCSVSASGAVGTTTALIVLPSKSSGIGIATASRMAGFAYSTASTSPSSTR